MNGLVKRFLVWLLRPVKRFLVWLLRPVIVEVVWEVLNSEEFEVDEKEYIKKIMGN